MKKREFLKKLKQELIKYNIEDMDDLLNNYANYIDEKIAMGLSEEEAVKSFGTIEEIVREIVVSQKKQNVGEDIISSLSKKIMNFIEQFFHLIKTKEPKELLKIFIEILLFILFIAFCHIPVELLENFGKFLFSILSNPINQMFYLFWKIILNFAYILISISCFTKFISKRYFIKDISSTKNTKAKNEKTVLNFNIVQGLAIIFKFLAILFLLGLSIYLILMGIILCLCVYFLFYGIAYYGLYLIFLALFLLGFLFFQLLYRFVIDQKGNFKRILAFLTISFLLLGSGCILATFEIADTTFVNDAPSNLEIETLKEELPFTLDLTLIGNIGDYIVDNSLANIQIIYKYYPIATKVKTNIEKKDEKVYLNWDFHELKISKELIFQMLNDLKEKKIYNYYLEPQIIVRANEEQIKILKENRQKYYHNVAIYSECEFVRTYQVLDFLQRNNDDFTYVTLASFLDDDVYTVKLNSSLVPNLEKNAYYEFLFKTYQSFIDTDIEEIFKDSEVLKVVKTNLVGQEQIQDKSCRIFY